MRAVNFRNKLWYSLRNINENMNAVFVPIIEKYGLTMIQARILVELTQNSKHTVGTLGVVIGMTGGNTSSICKRLEKMGVLRRIRCITDERCVMLELTEQGRQTMAEIDEEVEYMYQSILIKKTEAEFDCINKGLDQLRELLEELKQGY